MKKSKETILTAITWCLIFLGTYVQAAPPKKVAILETVDREDKIDYGTELMIRSYLASAITNTNGYEGYDRVDLSSISAEQDFQRTGLVSNAQIKKLGQMTGASYVLVTEVAKVGSEKLFIVAELLNVETAKLEQASTCLTNLDNIRGGCSNLASHLFGLENSSDYGVGELQLPYGTYNGQYKQIPNGKGKLIFFDNDHFNRIYYEGNWVDGLRQGYGKMEWSNGDYLIGQWKEGLVYGEASYYWKNGQYQTGNYKNGKLNGYGIIYYTNGDRYEGNWVNDEKDGKGKFYYAEQDKPLYFDGNWSSGEKAGWGVLKMRNGSSYEGEFKGDEFHGQGCYFFANGSILKGKWVHNKMNGEAIFWGTDGDRVAGNYKNDKEDGVWIRYDKNFRARKVLIYKDGDLLESHRYTKKYESYLIKPEKLRRPRRLS